VTGFYKRDWKLYNLVVTICTTNLAFNKSNFCVLRGSQNKQQLFPYTTLS